MRKSRLYKNYFEKHQWTKHHYNLSHCTIRKHHKKNVALYIKHLAPSHLTPIQTYTWRWAIGTVGRRRQPEQRLGGPQLQQTPPDAAVELGHGEVEGLITVGAPGASAPAPTRRRRPAYGRADQHGHVTSTRAPPLATRALAIHPGHGWLQAQRHRASAGVERARRVERRGGLRRARTARGARAAGGGGAKGRDARAAANRDSPSPPTPAAGALGGVGGPLPPSVNRARILPARALESGLIPFGVVWGFFCFD